MVSLSSWVAGVAFLLLVPGTLVLAFLGYARQLYAYRLIPVVFGGLLVAGLAVTFLLLPRLRARED